MADKTFTAHGIKKEIERVRWPKLSAALAGLATVLGAVAILAACTTLSDFISSLLLRG